MIKKGDRVKFLPDQLVQGCSYNKIYECIQEEDDCWKVIVILNDTQQKHHVFSYRLEVVDDQVETDKGCVCLMNQLMTSGCKCGGS